MKKLYFVIFFWLFFGVVLGQKIEKITTKDTIFVERKEFGNSHHNEEERHYIYDNQYVRMSDGLYKIYNEDNSNQDMIFRVENGFLHGKSIYITNENRIEVDFN